MSGLNVLLVGCGMMGGSLLEGWLAAGIVGRVVVIDPRPLPDLPDRLHRMDPRRIKPAELLALRAIGELPPGETPDVVVLAVKPQSMDAAVDDYRRFVGPATLFLSIAAGKTIGYFERRLGPGAVVVRAMPNTPAAVGHGMTVCCANPAAGPPQRGIAESLLAAVGEVAWVPDEALMDAVTALSGSGPAYVFLLIETLAKAGLAAGLPEALAIRLARATVIGSGELVRRSAETPEALRRNVTSPGGTTMAALSVLMAPDGLQPLFDRALRAATERSRELAG